MHFFNIWVKGMTKEADGPTPIIFPSCNFSLGGLEARPIYEEDDPVKLNVLEGQTMSK